MASGEFDVDPYYSSFSHNGRPDAQQFAQMKGALNDGSNLAMVDGRINMEVSNRDHEWSRYHR
jgi:hypothetical protein